VKEKLQQMASNTIITESGHSKTSIKDESPTKLNSKKSIQFKLPPDKKNKRSFSTVNFKGE